MSDESARMNEAAPGTDTPEGPHTDAGAEVVSHRHVENATVVHTDAAYYRGATFRGAIEVADESGLAALVTEGAERRFEGKLLWFGWAPKTRHPAIRIDGEWRIERGYSGQVVHELGRPDRPGTTVAAVS